MIVLPMQLMEESVMELLNLILQTDPLHGDEEEPDHDGPEKKPGSSSIIMTELLSDSFSQD